MNAWPLVRLGDILTKSLDWADLDSKRTYTEVTVRLWGRGVTARGEATGAQLMASRRHILRAGQLILSRIDARHGAIGVIPAELDGAVATNDFPAFVANEAAVLPEFLRLLARTEWFIEMCARASEGTTNRVRLKEDAFLRSEVPLPPLREQHRIVDLIERVDRAARIHRSLAANRRRDIDDLLRSAYDRLVDGARLAPMGEVAPLVRRPVCVNIDASYLELGIRSFGRGAFHKPALPGHAVGSKKLFHIEPGDLVFSNVFAWEGAVTVARECDRGRVGSHRFITCVPDSERMTAPFLCYHFLTEEGLHDLDRASPGGAGRNRTLGLKALADILVPVPPLAAQSWFNRLQQLRFEIAVHDERIQDLRARFVEGVAEQELGGA